MEFENRFTVKAPIDTVWTTIIDLEQTVPCVPGAEIVEKVDGDSYKVSIKVKLGPMSMKYRGDVRLREADRDTHTALLDVDVREMRGQGTAGAQTDLAVTPAPAGGTEVRVKTTVSLGGKVAAMGQEVIADVSSQLVDEFARRLAALIGAGQGPTPAAAPPPAPASEVAPAPPDDDVLDVGNVALLAMTSRLARPRTAFAVIAATALLGAVVGFVIGILV
jgi:carbon monoxide dehydrogenase subunit G